MPPTSDASGDVEKQKRHRPEGLKLTTAPGADRWVARIRSRGEGAIFGVLMGFLLFAGGGFIMVEGLLSGSRASVLQVVFPLAISSVGLYSVYLGAASLLNQVVIELDRRSLRFAERPFPTRRPRSIPIEKIDGFAVEEQTPGFWKRRSRTPAWTVAVRAPDAVSTRIHLDLPDPEQAAYVAEELENALEQVRAGAGTRG